MIQVIVNGEPRELEEPVMLPELVTRIIGDSDRAGIAAAVNGEVVSRDVWERTRVEDGDEVEIIAPFAGGAPSEGGRTPGLHGPADQPRTPDLSDVDRGAAGRGTAAARHPARS